jgi:hypothetical protein
MGTDGMQSVVSVTKRHCDGGIEYWIGRLPPAIRPRSKANWIQRMLFAWFGDDWLPDENTVDLNEGEFLSLYQIAAIDSLRSRPQEVRVYNHYGTAVVTQV